MQHGSGCDERLNTTHRRTPSAHRRPLRPPSDEGHHVLAAPQAVMASHQATSNESLSSTDFQNAANAFADKWKKFNSSYPDWSWIDCSNRLGFAAHGVNEGYLSLKNVFFQRSIEEEHDHDEGSSNDNIEPFDNATLVQSTVDDGDWYDFHVVYSPSYRVPVLYCHAQTSDGQPLNLEELEKNLPSKSSKVLIESKWTFITQQEHPYLNRPWFMLHPCGTSEWMKLLLDGHNSMDRYLAHHYMYTGHNGCIFQLVIDPEIKQTSRSNKVVRDLFNKVSLEEEEEEIHIV